jgi:hypothetical protein
VHQPTYGGKTRQSAVEAIALLLALIILVMLIGR